MSSRRVSGRVSGRIASAAAVLLLVGSCSSGGGQGGGNGRATTGASGATTATAAPTPSASATPRRSFDPPSAFDRAKGVPLPVEAKASAVLLDGLTAYLPAKEGLRAVDLTTGQVVGTAPTQQPAGLAETPVLAEVGGRRLVIGSFPEIVRGQGTSVDHAVAELVAMDAGTRAPAWSLPLDLPQGFAEYKYATLLGVRGTTAVLAVSDSDHGAVLAVDLAARKTLWTQNGFFGAALTEGQVVGIVSQDGVRQKLSALDLADGKTAWSAAADSYETTVRPAGPATVVVQGRDYGSAKNFAWLVDGTTGKQTLDFSGGFTHTCTYDGRSVTVCATESTAFAVEPTTGKVLWKLPDDANTRVSPRVTAVRHGVVYGTTRNGPVTLDATTGQDRPGSPQLAPVAVDEYVGLAPAEGTGQALTAYPATG
ncbi:PQQ-binding-like beta-propeller repeat protein [Kitasatospora sp. NPDC047058]|uniref:outer membrane protein assembly factor BamB family protein n=1 Tax=Kitasatospora sp. NPDC047058 TaxID=3155620 RepID=UPI0033D20487